MRRFKITILISLILVAVLATVFSYNFSARGSEYIEESGTTLLKLTVGNKSHLIEPWYSEVDDIYYYFIPSYENGFDENIEFDIKVSNEDKKAKNICANNLNTLFIDTESGNNDLLLEDVANTETGVLHSVTAKGKTEFLGSIEKIKGRGNSTWLNEEKKPLAVTLSEKASICSLKAGKKYALHAMSYEGDKLHSKFIYDMEKELGAEFTTGCNWANVYLNGQYYGLYLVEEAHKVDEGRIELPSEAILYQRASSDRTGAGQYFTLEDGKNVFIMEHPKEVSEEKLADIQQTVRIIDNQIHQGDFSNIDMETFAKYFLADELSMGYDAFKNSCFFYQLEPGGKIYAGPVWDYDLSFGETNNADPKYADPTVSIIDARSSQLDWYKILYQNEEFRNLLAQDIKELLPWFHKMMDETIDKQEAYISKSVDLDKLRWSNAPAEKYLQEMVLDSYSSLSLDCKSYRHPGGSYQTLHNDVRFFKYFLASRLNFLMDELGIDEERFVVENTDEIHTVTFTKQGKVVEEIKVKDGDFVPELPELSENETWRMSWCMDVYNNKLPVFEDVVLRSIIE